MNVKAIHISEFAKKISCKGLWMFNILLSGIVACSVAIAKLTLSKAWMVILSLILCFLIYRIFVISVHALYEHIYGAENRYIDHLESLEKSELLGLLALRQELSPHEVDLIKSVLSKRFPGWSFD